MDYIIDDKCLTAKEFIRLADSVWHRDYNEEETDAALSKTINITCRDGDRLVGSVRILTDGVYFGTITEILVHPDYRGQGIGRRLMELVKDNTPTKLYFGSRPDAIGFYEKLGLERGFESFTITPNGKE